LTGVGGIDVAGDEYAIAQNVANEVRLFIEDAYFIQDQGIPHFMIKLGQRAADSAILNSCIRRAALRVEGVKEVLSVTVSSFDPAARTLKGEVIFRVRGGANGAITVNL